MVVQQASAAVPAGGTATLTAYVVCIDSGSNTPDEGAGCALGAVQTGNLLQLAQCACGENPDESLNPFGGLGLMPAGWMISDGKSFGDMKSGGSARAMDQIFGDEGSQIIAGFVEMLEQPAKDWFDRCGIALP